MYLSEFSGFTNAEAIKYQEMFGVDPDRYPIYDKNKPFKTEYELAKAMFGEAQEAIEKYTKQAEKHFINKCIRLEKNVKNQEEFPLELKHISEEICKKVIELSRIFPI